MSRFLLTQSLISSWLYIYKAYDDYEDKAYGDFLCTLNRIDREPTEAMLTGIHLENMVNALVDDDDTFFSLHRIPKDKIPSDVINITDIVRGGQKQVALYKDKKINGIDFLLYGRLDYLKAGVIYDIKYSKKYEVGKFISSIQHPFYFELCPDSRNFEYIISNGEDVFIESYTRSQTTCIDETVSEFMRFLTDCKLIDVFFDKWTARG